jgi:Tfp pilus assembly protein PilV
MKLILQNSNKYRSAFTLIDVMVAMAFLGVVLSSLFACFIFGFNVVKSSREDLQATQILHEKMETIRVYTWPQVTNSSFMPATFQESMGNSTNAYFSGHVVVTDPTNTTENVTESYKANLKKVIITVDWTNNNSKRSRTISTYVSKYGMQNYILKP